jgi:hypothetical protein
MPRPRNGIELTPVWRGDEVAIHVHGDLVRVAAPADGLHIAIPGACHFFLPSDLLWEKLDLILDGKKVPKKL